jgi:hypothetical protein
MYTSIFSLGSSNAPLDGACTLLTGTLCRFASQYPHALLVAPHGVEKRESRGYIDLCCAWVWVACAAG